MKRLLVLSLILTLCLPISAAAKLSGSQTLSVEVEEDFRQFVTFTTVLEYEADKDLFYTLVFHSHPEKGKDIDFSVTKYFAPFSKTLYVTFGLNTGILNSPKGRLIYLSMTYSF